MKDENINKLPTRPRVLLSPLDWGLGHSTRCIPVIQALLKAGAVPVLAAEKGSAHLLSIEFPGLEIVQLQGYRISYSKSKKGFFRKIATQIPVILQQVRREYRFLDRLVAENRIDAVISDNRFGLHNKNIPSIYITHQLHLETGNPLFNRIAQIVHYRIIRKFDACWVPDHAGGFSIAGKLSHPKLSPPIPVKYVGLLSRFIPMAKSKTIDLCILLSGPEPQRSMLEKKMLEYLSTSTAAICLVRGLPGEATERRGLPENVKVFSHLPAAQLNELICQSKMVVCRAGYSTIMDLSQLQQKAILIPTPGQTEQEYLGRYLMEEGVFFCTDQENLNMKETLARAEKFTFRKLPQEAGNLQEIVQEFVHSIRLRR
ncbi:MAG: hypothetical protein JWQ27_1664 [Ferruginibacter sp.]|nr:hypothetical protein [Ferruginibacter sp.]